MNKAGFLVALLLGAVSGSVSGLGVDVVVDVPVELGALAVNPWQIARNDGLTWSAGPSLPTRVPIDALHQVGDDWMVSFSAPGTILGLETEPNEVLRWTPSGASLSRFYCGASIASASVNAVHIDGSDLLLSFDMPVDMGGSVRRPGDLLRLRSTGPGCSDWSFVEAAFESGLAGLRPGIDLVGASRRAQASGGELLLAFDVSVLETSTPLLPGDLGSWDGAILDNQGMLPGWPANRGAKISGLSVSDLDGDGVLDEDDCQPADSSVWAPPGPIIDLSSARSTGFDLTWSVPAFQGGALGYDVLWVSDPSDLSSAICLESGDTDTSASFDLDEGFFLVRVKNACGENLGTDSQGQERSAQPCP